MSVKRTKPLTSVITGMGAGPSLQRFRRQQPVRHRLSQYRTVRYFVAFFGTTEFVDHFSSVLREVITSLPLEFTTDSRC